MAQKILVIDDSQTASDLAENVFARHFPGCDVFATPRGSDVFERLNAASPDLVLLNDSLPEADAGAILARLGADPFSAATPVLLLADPARSGEYNGKFPNIARVLTKPVAMETLIEAIGGILGANAGCCRAAVAASFSAGTRESFRCDRHCRWRRAID
jgi:DNA-binding response OmpR family regulator